jgi:RND family efflux transporter MFP subunit
LIVGGVLGYPYAAKSGWLPASVVSQQSSWMPDIMQKRIEVRLESVKVQKGRSADALVVATGYLESRRQARIGARAAGRIDNVTFEEGDRVDKGEILAELEHRDMDASLAAAKATVARAKAALEEQKVTIKQATTEKDRVEDLWRSRSISESEYDLARFTLESAVARLNSMAAEVVLAEAQADQTEQLRENMFIRAPFAGTVISKDAELGESILPGGMGGGSGRGSVATIADLNHLQIECDVQEDFISRVKEGQEAEIAIDAVQDKKYHGRVRKIIPMGDRARATIKVQVEIDDADELLFPEMAGTVFFLPSTEQPDVTDEPRYFCNSSALTTDEQGQQYVWVVDAKKQAARIPVEAGEEKDGRIEILSGVTGKERVIVNPEELTVGIPLMVVE